LERIRSRLKPDSFLIFTLQLQGLSNPEVGEKLGVARQTITHKSRRIADLVQHLLAEEEGASN